MYEEIAQKLVLLILPATWSVRDNKGHAVARFEVDCNSLK
jgi:hypothetical protein